MLKQETSAVDALAPRLTPLAELGPVWDGPSLLADRVDQAVALAIDLPVARRRALRTAMRASLEAEVAARRELGRCEEDAVADALRATGSPAAFARRFLFPDERLRVEVSPVEAMGWCLRGFGGAAVALILAQYGTHAAGFSWHLLAGEIDHTPAVVSFAIWVGVPAALGARCGWRTRSAGWLALLATLSALAFVLPPIFRVLVGVPQPGEGERSLVHEAAFWWEAILRGWLPFAALAAGSAELVRYGLRAYRGAVRWRG